MLALHPFPFPHREGEAGRLVAEPINGKARVQSHLLRPEVPSLCQYTFLQVWELKEVILILFGEL
jgi:hypothetical protein